MGPDLSSGIIIELNFDNKTGLIQDDFDKDLKLVFDFDKFVHYPNNPNINPKSGDKVEYYILYQPQPTATNIYKIQKSDNNTKLPSIVKTKFWQSPAFWINVFFVLLGMLIGAWKNNLIQL